MVFEIWMIWIGVGIFFLISEIFTAGFFICLIGAACIAAGVTGIFTDSILLQLSVFSIVSILLVIFVRPVFMKYLTHDTTPSNVSALIGKEFVVDKEINKENTGYIKAGADYWKAKSTDGCDIPEGTTVIVEKMEGITVFVKKRDL